MSGFFEELKRRKVYRVAVAYVIAAGGIIQLASAVFPAWELPNWTLRLTIVLLLVGFPLALVLAWAFDVTPEGIRTTPQLPTAHSSHRRRNIAVLCLVGLLVSATAGFFLLPRASGGKLDKSIAVLPFQNFSDDPANAHFADGLQDDILTSLAKIGDLKVISRTSVMGYRGGTQNVREIGKALGVGVVLEGSVRREGNRVRLNVQLIDTATDRHLWAEDYDRELTDVFAIQTDLAQKIAQELQAKLSPSEKEQLTRKPTENGEAYLAFVQAHNLQANSLRTEHSIEKMMQAVQLYERALELDPKFALAAANLSVLHSWIYHGLEPTEAERQAARRYADLASALAPDAPETHLARGHYLYYGERDFDGALKEFALAERGLPNDSEVYLLIGAIQRRQGRWKESTENMEKAASLNPNDPWPLQNLVFNYQMQRDFAPANRVVERALALDPKSYSLWEIKSKLAIEERGDLSVAENALDMLRRSASAAPGLNDLETRISRSFAEADIALRRKKFAEAIASLEEVKLDQITDPRPLYVLQRRLLEGIAYQKMGRETEARDAFTRAKEAGETALRAAPDDPSRHGNFAHVLAHLGEKEAAIAEAKRAMELLPESVDAFEGPVMTTTLATVYAIVGENEKAIALFDALLNRPSGVTVASLKLDPVLEPLLKDPDFQKVLAKHEP